MSDGTKGADAGSLGAGDRSIQFRIRVERLKEHAVSETKTVCIDGIRDRTIAKRNSINRSIFAHVEGADLCGVGEKLQ